MKVGRTFDTLAAVMILTALLPAFLLLGLFIAATLGLPILFRQTRIGPDGRPFHLYKFRTMRASYDSDGRRLSDSERVRRLGSFLRRSGLDELPQLFNVLRGDMSFIGPRPLPPPIAAAPGSLVLKIADFLCSRKVYERVFLQAVLDMREEYNEALFSGRKEKARWVLIRAYLALAWTVALQVVGFLLSGPAKIIKSLLN